MKAYIVVVVILLAVSVVSVIFITTKRSEDTLVLSSVLFRHGERTVSFRDTYPNDPHQNNSYFPYGIGQLTIRGKKTMYKLGKRLRERYGDFLGDVYSSNILYAVSSYYARTKMSLQLVLAGLFPPKSPYIVDDELGWQPISFEYIKQEDDDMLAFWGKCTDFIVDVQDKFFSNEHFKKIDENSRELYRYMSEHSGKEVKSVFVAQKFYADFLGQTLYGLEIPDWGKKIFPDPLHYYFKENWQAYVQEFKYVKYASGRLLKTMGDSFVAKINGNLSEERKIHLYSGHDYSIAGLLKALKINHDYELPFGAYIAIELHRVDGKYGVKVFYQDNTPIANEPRTIENCTDFCPIDKFIELTKMYYPNPNIC